MLTRVGREKLLGDVNSNQRGPDGKKITAQASSRTGGPCEERCKSSRPKNQLEGGSGRSIEKERNRLYGMVLKVGKTKIKQIKYILHIRTSLRNLTYMLKLRVLFPFS